MASKKLNPIRAAIIKAVEAYAKGASGLVRAYEATITAYWTMGEGGDSKNPENLRFFINALKDHPRVQQGLVRIINKHGAFKMTTTGKPADRNYQVTEMKNVKIDDAKADDYRAAVKVFKAAELTSLLNEEGELSRDFDEVKAKDGFKKKAMGLIAELQIKHEKEEAMKKAVNADYEEIPFNPWGAEGSAFALISGLLNDIKNDDSGLAEAVKQAKERKEEAQKAADKRNEALKAARLEIIAESENAA